MSGFKGIEKNGVKIYTVPLFDKTEKVKTGFSTRHGGVSEGKYSSLNFSFTTGDKKENVIENYKRYCDTLDIDINKMVLTTQTHEDNVHVAKNRDLGAMVTREAELPEADALITDTPGVTLVKFSADCPIIYLLDIENTAVGLVHSGWRSTAMNIVANTIKTMQKEYGTKPESLLAAISPSIEVCCFEVGNEVAKIFSEGYGEDVLDRSYDKPHVNLKETLKRQLLGAGVIEKNISYANKCTGCEKDEFHTYRITKGRCGLSIGTITLL